MASGLLKQLVGKTQAASKNQVKAMLKWLGLELLSKAETEAYLSHYQIASQPENTIELPTVTDAADGDKLIFDKKEAVTAPTYVWQYEPTGKRTTLLPCGGLVTEGKALCTDFNNQGFLKDVVRRGRPERIQVKTLIAPWSHYVDGVVFGGYYDYMMLVAAKLCRIKEALPDGEFAEAVVAYPLFYTTYEREFLALLGVSADAIFDSRITEITFERSMLANSGEWFYPNVADIRSLRRQVLSAVQPERRERNRIYISRSGRRRVQNEAELIQLLGDYDFKIIEDQPRSLAEQVSIYRNASFIIGPHGASFTNILWCDPGTHLFELFSPNYAPDFFLYMAQVLGLTYSAHYQGASRVDSFNGDALDENMTVSLPDLQKCLNAVLGG